MFVQQQIVGLDVSVYHTFAPQVVQGQTNLKGVDSHRVFVKLGIFGVDMKPSGLFLIECYGFID